ncbi:hypothetical protein Agub_g15139 [Astrephomene gubernaculifera]|uniref:Uncharacterized protein n=1 Tax=Astrephomene gubernaculifera TaxID=47775 RepID=A0AAD3HTN4_9CHLO|nr:hypothetical protein Agub_g15139 [Astrephomene gubernaculifera]
MSGWRIVVNWFLPPPLVLTILLILPMPGVVKKGLLTFTRKFLFINIGHVRLVHLALLITGAAFAACTPSGCPRSPCPRSSHPTRRPQSWQEGGVRNGTSGSPHSHSCCGASCTASISSL